MMMQQAPVLWRRDSSANRWWTWASSVEPFQGEEEAATQAILTAPPSDNSNEESKKEEAEDYVQRAALGLHVLLWLASVALVAVLFATRTPPTLTTFTLSPVVDAGLNGTAPLHVDAARGLFADVNVAIACLVSQTTTALLVPERRVGGIVVASTAILLLFMQDKWRLSFGGLLWAQLVLGVAFFAVGARLRGAVLPLSLPVLAAAALANAGERDATSLTYVYFALCGMPLLWALADTEPREWVGVLAWLSVVPLYVRGGLVLAASSADHTAYAGLVFVLVWVGALLLGLGAWPQLTRPAQTGLYALHQLAHAALLLLLLAGAFFFVKN